VIMLELYAGTRSIGRAFERRGHTAYSVEWDKRFEDITWYGDVGELTVDRIREICGGRLPDVLWASPDCTTYSVAALHTHRRQNPVTKYLEPQTDYARRCDETNTKTIALIKELLSLSPRMLYFIENPRACMRKMPWMVGIPRYTVTYCQYGDTRMKPTDIWTNHPDPGFKPPCNYGDDCHDRAPRGTRCGTQALKGSKDRSRIPDALCDHIVSICEDYVDGVDTPRLGMGFQARLEAFQ